jgi:hypothetical protein
MMFDEKTHSHLTEPLRRLAQESVFIGTSSWKYPGWCGQIYDESRYITRNKFSQSRFERECLSEYAEIFPTVFELGSIIVPCTQLAAVRQQTQ